jgi:hypothetical protein
VNRTPISKKKNQTPSVFIKDKDDLATLFRSAEGFDEWNTSDDRSPKEVSDVLLDSESLLPKGILDVLLEI